MGLSTRQNSYRDPSRNIPSYAELEALDPTTGQLRWRHEVAQQQNTNAELSSAPVVANGVVYLASAIWAKEQTQTQRGPVEALDSHNGSVR
jgi:outer membrane protein assembly factor BamB